MSILQSWERQEGESTPAYTAFAVYRSLGNRRSLDAVAEQLNKSRTLIARWSARYTWVERVRTWDEWLGARQVADPQAIDKVQKFQERAIETSRQLQSFGSAVMSGAIQQLSPYLKGDKVLEPQHAIALGRLGVALKQVGLEAEAQAIGAAEILETADEIRETLQGTNSGEGS